MSLATQIAALASRVAQEINAVRSELTSNSAPRYGAVDGGAADTYYGWYDYGIDGGNATSQFTSGLYLDGGNS